MASTPATTPFASALQFLKPWEGVDSDHPADRGSRTRFGISQAAHPDVDIENLTWEQAVEIYRTEYWGASGANRAPPKLGFVLFDSAVQHGADMAIRLMQRAVGVTDDGIYGPVTERAVQAADSPHLEMLGERGEHYARIIAGDPSQRVFMDGWFRRLIYVTEYTTHL